MTQDKRTECCDPNTDDSQSSTALSALPINDDDLSRISQSQSLRDLVLDHSRITEKGLNHLSKLAKLRAVSVKDIPIKKELLDRFRKNCPQVHVHYSGEFKWCNARDQEQADKIDLFPTAIVPSDR